MAWRRAGDKPLPETIHTQFTDIYTGLGVDELIHLAGPDNDNICIAFGIGLTPKGQQAINETNDDDNN